MQSPIRILAFTGIFALLGGCAPSSQAKPAASVTKTLHAAQPLPASTHLKVENLAGHVQVNQGGSQLEVTATVVAGGKDQAAARKLADTVKLDVSHDHGQIVLHVDYPVGQHDSYQYIPTRLDEQAHGSVHVLGFNIDISRSSTSLTYQGHEVHVYQGKSGGVPLHVDLDVTLPAGSDALVVNHVGTIQAANLKGRLALETGSGNIVTKALSGHLQVHAGSGDVHVAHQQGQTDVRTGSGDVTLQQLRGALDLRTGSGDVHGRDLHGDALTMRTGSGDIELHTVEGKLDLNTGSGDITIDSVGKVPAARIECGSGDILLRGDLSGVQSFDMQTGSGDVTLISHNPPPVHLDVHASSVDAHWPGIRNAHSARRAFSGDVGHAGGQGRIHTGSGDVTLKQ